MRELAPGKINLCLLLGELRDDGRHALVTAIESVSLADELEVSVADGADSVVCDGVYGPNIVTQALEALRAHGWNAPPVRVEIRKRVPVAAGMGGGSADAAAILRVAAALQPLPDEVITRIAEGLGADVPSQLVPGLALGTGAGETVQPRSALAEHALVIVPGPNRLSTADVYAEADRLGLPRTQDELAARLRELDAALAPGATLPAELLVNDLEPAAVSLCPDVAVALDAVRTTGADHALVCGSGPTVAGLCWGAESGARATEIAAALCERFPLATRALPVSSPTSGTI